MQNIYKINKEVNDYIDGYLEYVMNKILGIEKSINTQL